MRGPSSPIECPDANMDARVGRDGTVATSSEGVLVFDADAFVGNCPRAAASASDPIGAVEAVVAEAVLNGPSIDAELGTEIKREGDILFSSEHLTVLRILWPGGIWAEPHDHRMWAVIGVYAGEECNRFFERAADGLTEVDICAVGVGDVLALDVDAIHAVDNPHREVTGGLHVYGGDLSNVQRSAWGPDRRETPFAENACAQSAMFQVVRDALKEHGYKLDHDDRFALFRTLEAVSAHERRYPTPTETRSIIDGMMNRASSERRAVAVASAAGAGPKTTSTPRQLGIPRRSSHSNCPGARGPSSRRTRATPRDPEGTARESPLQSTPASASGAGSSGTVRSSRPRVREGRHSLAVCLRQSGTRR